MNLVSYKWVKQCLRIYWGPSTWGLANGSAPMSPLSYTVQVSPNTFWCHHINQLQDSRVIPCLTKEAKFGKLPLVPTLVLPLEATAINVMLESSCAEQPAPSEERVQMFFQMCQTLPQPHKHVKCPHLKEKIWFCAFSRLSPLVNLTTAQMLPQGPHVAATFPLSNEGWTQSISPVRVIPSVQQSGSLESSMSCSFIPVGELDAPSTLLHSASSGVLDLGSGSANKALGGLCLFYS